VLVVTLALVEFAETVVVLLLFVTTEEFEVEFETTTSSSNTTSSAMVTLKVSLLAMVLPVDTGSIIVTALTLPRVTSTTLIREEGIPSSSAMLATKASSKKSSNCISSFIVTDTAGVITNLYHEYFPPRIVTVKVRF
jgi:hypothetical protein